MNMITKDYLDTKLKEVVGELSRRMDDRFDQLDEKIDDLAGMTARGFTELRTELLLRED